MPRKCHDCGNTKNLKSVWVEEDENGNHNDKKSICRDCFFDNEWGNEDVSHVTKENWDDHNYHWKPKMISIRKK